MTPAAKKMPAASEPVIATMPQTSVAMYRRIATAFLLLTTVIVVLVAYVVLSHATVVVLSKQEPVSADFVVDVAAKPTQDEIPGAVLQLSDSLTQTFPATSVVKIDEPATGKVKITSALFRPQTLIATTRLLTPDGILFRLKKTVVVPAFGSVVADVFADKPGADGAVGNVTFTIPGLNPDTARFFKAETFEPIDGGVKELRMVTTQDVDAAVAVLKDKLESSLAERLRGQAKEAGAATTGEMLSYELDKKLTDVPVGDEAESFTLTYAETATGVFYDRSKFADLIRGRLTEQLDHERKLLSVDASSVDATIEKADVGAMRANVHFTVKGVSVLSPKAQGLSRDKLVGITVDAAKTYLQHLDGVASASVSVSPFWVDRLPNVADHITVEVR